MLVIFVNKDSKKPRHFLGGFYGERVIPTVRE